MLEAVEIIDELRESRFRVYKNQNVVTLNGVISDTTTFECLDGIVETGLCLDFAHVDYASWQGLRGLIHYLEDGKIRVSVRNIPTRIFDCLKLFGEIENTIQLESVELECSKSGSSRPNQKVFALTDLESCFSRGELSPVDQDFILSPLRYVLLNKNRNEADIPFVRGWPVASQAEVSFWISYMLFTQSTIKLAHVLLHATEINILEHFAAIRDVVDGGQSALKLIDPLTSFTLLKRLDSSIDEVRHKCAMILDEVDIYVQNTNRIWAALFHEVVAPTSKEKFYRLVGEYFENVTKVNLISDKFEVLGPVIGDSLAKLRSINIIKTTLAGIREVDAKTLENLRDSFSIMSLASEGNWVETKKEIVAILDGVDSSIGRCVVNLQGFDLLRQILEHRLGEGLIVAKFLPQLAKDSHHWDELKSEILQKIGHHLVTEQEKAAFSFYLPEGFKKYGTIERKEPGDVLLF